MQKIKKTFRITQETADKLEEIAKEQGCTATAALEYAIQNSHTNDQNNHTEPYSDKVLDALTQQLAVKDEQIRSLGKALKDAQEVARSAQETAKAAQALHGAAVLPKAIEGTEKEKKKTFWERIWGD